MSLSLKKKTRPSAAASKYQTLNSSYNNLSSIEHQIKLEYGSKKASSSVVNESKHIDCVEEEIKVENHVRRLDDIEEEKSASDELPRINQESSISQNQKYIDYDKDDKICKWNGCPKLVSHVDSAGIGFVNNYITTSHQILFARSREFISVKVLPNSSSTYTKEKQNRVPKLVTFRSRTLNRIIKVDSHLCSGSFLESVDCCCKEFLEISESSTGCEISQKKIDDCVLLKEVNTGELGEDTIQFFGFQIKPNDFDRLSNIRMTEYGFEQEGQDTLNQTDAVAIEVSKYSKVPHLFNNKDYLGSSIEMKNRDWIPKLRSRLDFDSCGCVMDVGYPPLKRRKIYDQEDLHTSYDDSKIMMKVCGMSNIEYWESLYPGWMIDPASGKWYQMDVNISSSSVQGNLESNAASAWPLSDCQSEVSYLQKSVVFVAETMAEHGRTESATFLHQVS